MSIEVRDYNEKDLSFIETSFESLHDYLVSIDPIKRLRKTQGYMEVYFQKFLQDIKNNKGKIYIATENNQPIGFIAGFVADKQSEENLLEVVPSQLGVISDIYLIEEYRRKGVGSILINKMEEYLIKEGCDALWVNTNGFNTSALNLYHKNGFTDREIGLIKKIR